MLPMTDRIAGGGGALKPPSSLASAAARARRRDGRAKPEDRSHAELLGARRREASAFRGIAAKLLVVSVLAAVAVAALGRPAAAVPSLPANTGCGDAAVVAKLSVLEDRAAANMLAEALDALSPSSSARCLIDGGDPSANVSPSQTSRRSAGAARTVYVVGGPAALSDSWLRQELGVTSFVRIAGSTRWGTQASVASAMVALARGDSVAGYDAGATSPSTLPPNGACTGAAVLVKLSVREDRAAANMLTEALAAVGGTVNSRCLVDVGNPATGEAPTQQSVMLVGRSSSRTVVGGSTAVPQSWLKMHFGLTGVGRVAGNDRWATQAAVAAEIVGLANRQDTAGAHDIVLEASPDDLDGLASRATKGSFEVPVFICADPSHQYTLDFLESHVSELNQQVGAFYSHQSSGTATLVFTPGAIIDGRNDATDGNYDKGVSSVNFNKAYSGGRDDPTATACVREADALTDKDNPLVLIDAPVLEKGTHGMAKFRGPMSQPMLRQFMSTFGNQGGSNLYYDVVGHEIGHAVFILCHVHQPGSRYPSCPDEHDAKVFVPELRGYDRDVDDRFVDKCSIMSYCRATSPNEMTERVWVSCGAREILDWPEGPPPPLGPACDFDASDDVTVPSAPQSSDGAVSEGNTTLEVAWRPPSDDGGGVDTYRLTIRRSGGSTATATTNGLTYTFAGLANGHRYTVEIRAVNGAGQSSPLVLSGTPRNLTPQASVRSVRLHRGATDSSCQHYTDIAQCAWFDIDVSFSEGDLPSSVTVTCHTQNFNNDRAWLTRTIALTSGRDTLGSGVSTELDRVCRYAYPGNTVYVTVDGVASGLLYWNQVTTQAPARVSGVSLFKGTATSSCENYRDISRCAWFDIDLRFSGTEVPGSVTISCHTRNFNNDRAWLTRTVTLTSSKSQLESGTTTELDRVCRYAYSGNQVYVSVGGIRSNYLTWP